MTVLDFAEITKTTPEKSLIRKKRSTGGRNNQGHITSRHRGGGVKRRYRLVDFKRDKFDILATVSSIEYDPNRSARIALLNYVDGEKRYIIAPLGVEVGMKVMSSKKEAPFKPGNTMPLEFIPLGLSVHNIELIPGKGGALVRSAGQHALLRSREGGYAQLKLPSGEIRMINNKCLATIGQVGNPEKMIVSLGKAGKNRYRGVRPQSRGVVMNPVDHPMGGGEGRTSGGSHPVSPWGQLAKGFRTRHKKKTSSRFIVERRKK
jgi:large subunit ribosomal protein L2